MKNTLENCTKSSATRCHQTYNTALTSFVIHVSLNTPHREWHSAPSRPHFSGGCVQKSVELCGAGDKRGRSPGMVQRSVASHDQEWHSLRGHILCLWNHLCVADPEATWKTERWWITPSSWYKGLWPAVIKSGIAARVIFLAFETICMLLAQRHDGKKKMVEKLIRLFLLSIYNVYLTLLHDEGGIGFFQWIFFVINLFQFICSLSQHRDWQAL